jgi:hypothetical protein
LDWSRRLLPEREKGHVTVPPPHISEPLLSAGSQQTFSSSTYKTPASA